MMIRNFIQMFSGFVICVVVLACNELVVIVIKVDVVEQEDIGSIVVPISGGC